MKTFALAILLLALSACGGKVEVSGTVHHKLEIDLSSLEEFFLKQCSDAHSPDPAACAAAQSEEFLSFLEKTK